MKRSTQWQSASVEEMAHLGKGWIWFFVVGLIYVALGAAAFSMPVTSTVTLTFALSAMLIVGGIALLVQAIQLRHRHGAIARFLRSLITLVAGGLMFRYPGGGMLGIALLLSFYFFMSGAVQANIAFSLRPHRGWGWTLLSSACSFALGIYIVATFPFSAIWVPGLLLGVDLVVAGFAMIAFAFAAHSIARSENNGPSLRPSHVT